jgi:hypothetical protein
MSMTVVNAYGMVLSWTECPLLHLLKNYPSHVCLCSGEFVKPPQQRLLGRESQQVAIVYHYFGISDCVWLLWCAGAWTTQRRGQPFFSCGQDFHVSWNSRIYSFMYVAAVQTSCLCPHLGWKLCLISSTLIYPDLLCIPQNCVYKNFSRTTVIHPSCLLRLLCSRQPRVQENAS